MHPVEYGRQVASCYIYGTRHPICSSIEAGAEGATWRCYVVSIGDMAAAQGRGAGTRSWQQALVPLQQQASSHSIPVREPSRSV